MNTLDQRLSDKKSTAGLAMRCPPLKFERELVTSNKGLLPFTSTMQKPVHMGSESPCGTQVHDRKQAWLSTRDQKATEQLPA
jgi:hypothetical protein